MKAMQFLDDLTGFVMYVNRLEDEVAYLREENEKREKMINDLLKLHSDGGVTQFNMIMAAITTVSKSNPTEE